MRTNYVLIDYENVQPSAVERLKEHAVKVLVFVGANQNKIALDLVMVMQSFGTNAEYVKVDGAGNNALDFHIAFHIGRLSEHDPNAYFHIISKDTGFDPLIRHLHARKLHASRSRDIPELPFVRLAQAQTPEARIQLVIDNLRGRGNSRPRKLTSLSNTINAIFLNKLDVPKIQAVIDDLKARSLIRINGDKVSYELPAG